MLFFVFNPIKFKNPPQNYNKFFKCASFLVKKLNYWHFY